MPPWLRRALFATAVLNMVVGATFVPGAGAFRAAAGLPVDAHPFYLLTVGLFVFLFGLVYLWTAVRNRPEPLFIGMAAAGKISFFVLLVSLWAAGELPLRAPLVASADLVCGTMFLVWLWGGTDA